jgi:hypothetical protein
LTFLATIESRRYKPWHRWIESINAAFVEPLIAPRPLDLASAGMKWDV